MSKMTPAKFVAIQLKIDKKKAELENLKDELAAAEEELMPLMVEDGITSAKTPNGTVGISRMIWASSGGDVQSMKEALKKDGLDEMVTETVNRNSLSGFAREYDPEKRFSPEQIVQALRDAGFEHTAEAIKISEVVKLKVTGK
jgi:hypothetical protein